MSEKKSNKIVNLEQVILRCTRSGNIKDFRVYLKDWKDGLLNWKHPRSGETCLLLCARYGHVDMLRCLVEEFGESLEQRNNDGKRALHEAAQGGHLECVKYIISRNVEVDCLKRADWTPLMLACTKQNMDLIAELLQAGANPKLLNKDGWNSFHIAAREGNANIVQYFLNVYPNIWDTVSNNGRTPLHTAALHGHLESVKLLLKCGNYSCDCADACGSTPLMDSFRSNYVDVASYLITKHHASTEAMDKLGRQCIHIAAQSGSLLSLKYLVDQVKVDFRNAVDYSGMTALHIAAKEGHVEAVVFLMEAGSDINSQDNNARTALHLASAAGQTSTVAMLMSLPNTDVTLIDINKLTAADLALKLEVKEIFAKYEENLPR